MKFTLPLALVALSLTACSSAPKGGTGEVDSIYPTALTSPKELNFAQVNDEKYVKSWTKEVGGGYDDYKKVTIPAYTVEFATFSQDVDQNRLTTMFVKADGAKNILDMTVTLPMAQHQALMQEIADESRARLVTKLQKIGLEVVDWNAVKAKSEDARDFEKDKLNLDPTVTGTHSVSVAAKGLGRLNSIFWNASAASTVRDTEIGILVPHFKIGFGYFGGQKTERTIVETHGPASLEFTPQIQVYSGSGFKTSGKYEGGNITLDGSAVSNEKFAKALLKEGDNRGLAAEKTNNMKAIGAGVHGTSQENIVVSTRAGLHYNIDLDTVKYKATVLKQLDAVEDMLVARYKAEL